MGGRSIPASFANRQHRVLWRRHAFLLTTKGDIVRILDEVRSAFHLATTAEITLESNPGDIGTERIEAWLKAGINRLSIGVQSLDDGLLRLLGRRHTAREALDAHKAARNGGFTNINLDLMYGLPHQTLDQWRATVRGSAGKRTGTHLHVQPHPGRRHSSGGIGAPGQCPLP